MLLAFQFDTPPELIPAEALPFVDYPIWEVLGAVLSVAVINEARSRDGRLERYLATGYMTDTDGNVTHRLASWGDGDDGGQPSAPLVDLARHICQVGDDNAWTCGWPAKVFGNCFWKVRATTRWSSSRTAPLTVEGLVDLPGDVTERAVRTFTAIIENVWFASTAQDHKRQAVLRALDWREGAWKDREAIERAVVDAVMKLDSGRRYDLDGQDSELVVRLRHVEVGRQHEFANA